MDKTEAQAESREDTESVELSDNRKVRIRALKAQDVRGALSRLLPANERPRRILRLVRDLDRLSVVEIDGQILEQPLTPETFRGWLLQDIHQVHNASLELSPLKYAQAFAAEESHPTKGFRSPASRRKPARDKGKKGKATRKKRRRKKK